VSECKPLMVGEMDPEPKRLTEQWIRHNSVLNWASMGQGLTLVHFSAQPEPILTQHTP